MTVWIIPIDNAKDLGAFRFSVDLEGLDYQFEFQFNDRDQYWYFNMLDSQNVMIKSGIKVVINYPLFHNLVSETRPPGEIVFQDSRETIAQLAQDPGLEELGTDVLMMYVEST